MRQPEDIALIRWWRQPLIACMRLRIPEPPIIVFNRAYFETATDGALAFTLLHELIHAWQHRHGIPDPINPHNPQWLRAARLRGLCVNHRGHRVGPPQPPFSTLLKLYGIDP